MDYFYFFLIIGSVAVYLILKFDKLQRRKEDALLIQTKNVQPLFLVRSTEQKLSRLNEVLNNGAAGNQIGDQLKSLTADYNCGHISMQTYSNELNALLHRAGER